MILIKIQCRYRIYCAGGEGDNVHDPAGGLHSDTQRKYIHQLGVEITAIRTQFLNGLISILYIS